MQLKISLKVALVALVVVSSCGTLADQKIKTKSNIKNDRLAGSSAAACVEQKEGSADGKTPCKTNDSESSTSAASDMPAAAKPQ